MTKYEILSSASYGIMRRAAGNILVEVAKVPREAGESPAGEYSRPRRGWGDGRRLLRKWRVRACRVSREETGFRAWNACTRKAIRRRLDQGACAPWTPTRGKNVKTHGMSVRATRNPRPLSQVPEVNLPRFAERRPRGTPFQEPPRITRRLQSPDFHALPFVGAPT